MIKKTDPPESPFFFGINGVGVGVGVGTVGVGTEVGIGVLYGVGFEVGTGARDPHPESE